MIEQLGQINVAQERALGMSLFAEAQRFAAQALLRFDAIENRLNVIRSTEVENNGHQLSVADAFLAPWRIVETDGQPHDLAVADMLARAQMLLDHFEDRLGTKLADAFAADAREVSGNAIRNGIFQAFFALTEPNESSSLRW